MSAASLRVLLVDDHALVRSGIRALLDAIPGVTVVAEQGSAEEALALVREGAPDIVITDISMKGMNGLALAEQLRQVAPATRVIILSMHDDLEYAQQALRAGAAGYLLKDAATAELERALREVAAGGSYFSPAVSTKVMQAYVQQLDGAPSRPDALTERQREILRRLAQGKRAKEIAFDLKLSVKTVEAHRSQIMERLGIRDLAGLVRFAVREGLVSSDE
jgi:DNA-binding NarL/FixJ family response regulator